jgi:hypothetical protein
MALALIVWVTAGAWSQLLPLQLGFVLAYITLRSIFRTLTWAGVLEMGGEQSEALRAHRRARPAVRRGAAE